MFKDKEIIEMLKTLTGKVDKTNSMLKKIILKGETK